MSFSVFQNEKDKVFFKETLHETVSVSFHANTLWKGMSPAVLLAIAKGHVGSLALDEAIYIEES